MKRTTLILYFTLLHLSVFSQKEWSNWYRNGRELLTFKNGYAEKVTDFINSVPPFPPYENLWHFYYHGEGGISYSDPVTGDLKFIISQQLGYSKDFNIFPINTFIRSCPDQKSYHIIPFHNNPNKFYVLQFQSISDGLAAQESGLQVRCPNALGLGYSIVDLTLNRGLGDFSTTNNFIDGSLTEQITLVRHANAKDVWIIVHPYGTAQYNAILATDAGFQPPKVSNIGALINSGYKSSGGEITASHDGKMLAGCRSITAETGSESDIELFDFDNATGLLSNYRTMPSIGHVLKLQFSPDNSKLYSAGFDDKYNNSELIQWDFNQLNVAASKTIVAAIPKGDIWDMQLAPDGKIYASSFREYIGDDYHNYLIAIQCPNLPQFACNINKRAIEATTSFPDLVNDFINVPKVPQLPKFSLGNDTAICFGTLLISAPPGWQSYKWNTGETTQSITVNKAGLFYVITGSSSFSCPSGYGYINVADKAIKLNLGKDTLLCAKSSYHLYVPDNYTDIIWANGSHVKDSILNWGSNIIISANDINGCHTTDTIDVNYKSLPKAAFGSDTTLCNTETLKLQLQPYSGFNDGAVYNWQDNSVEDHYNVSKPGIYWGKATYQGCTVSDTIKVNYISAVSVNIGNDTTLCIGDSLLLSALINVAKYQWSTGETTQSIYVKNTSEYRIAVTNGSCIVRDTIMVSFKPKPILSLGNDTTLCDKSLLKLFPDTGDGNYLWQDGSLLNSFTVSKPGIYWLKFSVDGCALSDTINITFKNLPPLNLGKDTGFCNGTSIKLNAHNVGIQNYLWQDQTILSSYTVINTGNYWVEVTGTNGCKNQDTISLKMLPIPVFTLGRDTAICDGNTLFLRFDIVGANYLWNDGSNLNRLSIKSPGIYWLTINNNGCSKQDSIEVNYKPNPIVHLGNDTTLCEGIIKTLAVSNANTVYNWQDGSINNIFTVNKQGLYFVTASMKGCIAKDSINIWYTPKPIFTLGRDTFICKGQSILLRPIINTITEYHWQNGSNATSYNITDTGTYVLIVTNECGTYSDSIRISRGVCQLYVPSAFSPNMDNLNDVFRIKYPFVVKRYNIAIFNKFGQKIFESADMTKAWDGNYNGEAQSVGAYVWIISLTDIDGKDKIVKGTVMLLK